jgi:MFS transporter, DHA1 family, arabinose polymer utilization protein
MFKNKSLLALSLGGFGIGMTEFVMMGLLPDIATSLTITIPQAGHLISLYALGVVVGAPVIAGLSGRFKPKSILQSLMLFFMFAHILSAFAPNYPLMMLARFVAGLPHGAFFGVGAVVASRLAQKGKAAQAISVMFFGLTIANVVGVPLGTYLGHTFNWRIVMGIIAVIGLLTFLAVRTWLPEVAANADASFRKDLRIFKRSETWFAIAIVSIGTGGLFAWFSYIAPLSINESGFAPSAVMFVLITVGLGMSVGNSLGGYLADTFSPVRATCGLMLAMTACLLIGVPAASYQWSMLLMAFITGMIAFAVVAPIQVLIIRATEGSEMLGSSLGQAGFNVGNALGAFLGGLPLVYGYGYRSPQIVGSGLALTGAAIAGFLAWRTRGATRSSALT